MPAGRVVPAVVNNRLAENFGRLGLDRPANNGAPGGTGRRRDGRVDEDNGGRHRPGGRGDGDDANVSGFRLLLRHIRSAKAHAREGRAREMEDDLARARELARHDARQRQVIMTFYEERARDVRNSLRLGRVERVERR